MHQAERATFISAQDFMALGMNDLAYVRPVEIEGQTVFAVHAADGRQITVLPSRELAFSTIRQNEMTPVSVH